MNKLKWLPGNPCKQCADKNRCKPAFCDEFKIFQHDINIQKELLERLQDSAPILPIDIIIMLKELKEAKNE